jgi:hypothetical protein
MPKLDWDLINRAGATQQVRGEKAEQKYSDFTSLYDSLKLHEKYNESYQNWRTKTDEELDALINNYGGKLGTTGFNRDLDKLIGSKKNDPWIKNAIQSSENAKLYEENILRNPDIKPYNDPNAETYLGWLEDKTPTFKYKGFYKDAPPEDWFATNASKFPAAKWTEFAEWGKHGMKTIQHDAKNAADIEKRFNDMKGQFAKTPEGQQFQRMLDAGEYGSLTYDEAFGIYADAAASAVSYDNWSATASQDINKQVTEQIRQFEENKKIQKQQLENQRKHFEGSLNIQQQQVDIEKERLRIQEEQGYFTKSSTSGGITDAAVDELLLPIVRSAKNEPDKFNAWKNGPAGGKYETKIAFGTTGSNTLKTRLEDNVMQGNTELTTKSGKQISTATLNDVIKAYDEKAKLQAVDNITLVKTENGAEARVNFTTPVYTREKAKKIIDGYNERGPAKELTLDDFEKSASGDYILRVEGKDEAVSEYFNGWSQSPTIGTGINQVPNPLYTPLTVPGQQNTTPPSVSNTNYSGPQTTPSTQQTNQTTAGTTSSPDTSVQTTNIGTTTPQQTPETLLHQREELRKELEQNGFKFDNLRPQDGSALSFSLSGLTNPNDSESFFSYVNDPGSNSGYHAYIFSNVGSISLGDSERDEVTFNKDDSDINIEINPIREKSLKFDGEKHTVKGKNGFEYAFFGNSTIGETKQIILGKDQDGNPKGYNLLPGEVVLYIKDSKGSASTYKLTPPQHYRDRIPGAKKNLDDFRNALLYLKENAL